MQSSKIQIRIEQDGDFGNKIAIYSDDPTVLVNVIRELDWNLSHRKYTGGRWLVDMAAKQALAYNLNAYGFKDTAAAVVNLEIPKINKIKLKLWIDNRHRLYNINEIKKKDSEIFERIRQEILGFPHPHERRIRKYAKKDLSDWDGYVFCGKYHWKENYLEFDAGRLAKMKKMLENIGFEITVYDSRQPQFTSEPLEFTKKYTLWQPQFKAALQIERELALNKVMTFQMPTGTGKTLTAAYIISRMNKLFILI